MKLTNLPDGNARSLSWHRNIYRPNPTRSSKLARSGCGKRHRRRDHRPYRLPRYRYSRWAVSRFCGDRPRYPILDRAQFLRFVFRFSQSRVRMCSGETSLDHLQTEDTCFPTSKLVKMSEYAYSHLYIAYNYYHIIVTISFMQE